MPYNSNWFTKPRAGVKLNHAHPLSRGLVGYWVLNEGSGTIVYDISGSGQHGTLTGFSFSSTSGWTGSPMGGGLRGDGSNDVVNCGSSSILNPIAMSWCSWVMTTSLSQPYQSPFTRRLGVGNTYAYTWAVKSNGRVAIYVRTAGDTAYDGTGAHIIAVNKWYFVAFTYSSSDGLKGYVNGVLDGTAAANGNISQVADVTYLMDDPYTGGGVNRTWTGCMDETRVYNRVLLPNEIKTLYANPHINLMSNRALLI